jgi:uncharacterized membrane protein
MESPGFRRSPMTPNGQVRPADVNTAMIHFYRAEITRANSWRGRLDVTTNWALISTGAAISLAFSQSITHHSIIILNTLLVTLFLFIEARRYRYYELWSYRVRLMETDFYAPMLIAPHSPDPEWASKLAESLLHPQFPISNWEALGRRLRRNYLWIYLVLLGVWFAKLLLYPEAVQSWDQLVTRARIGVAPGWLIMSLVLVFYVGLTVLALVTRRLQQSVGEVFPRYGDGASTPKARPVPAVDPQMETQAEPEHPYPLLAIVSADNLSAIGDRIKTQFKREARQLDPNNTSGTRSTLTLPVTVIEVPTLKALVKEVDEAGVVVVIPADEIFTQSAKIQQVAKAQKS